MKIDELKQIFDDSFDAAAPTGGNAALTVWYKIQQIAHRSDLRFVLLNEIGSVVFVLEDGLWEVRLDAYIEGIGWAFTPSGVKFEPATLLELNRKYSGKIISLAEEQLKPSEFLDNGGSAFNQ